MDSSKEVTDSTDWHETRVPSLAALDSSLRCQICKDYFTSPVSTTCGHTFCSLCVRRYFTTAQQCPTCRTRLSDGDSCLRQNHTVQEILSSFVGARDTLMQELIKKAPPPLPIPTPSTLEDGGGGGASNGRRRSKRQQSTVVSRGSSSADAESEYAGSTASQTEGLRRSTRSRRTNGTPQLPPPGVEIIGIDDDIEEDGEDEERQQRGPSSTARRRKNQSKEDHDDDDEYDPEDEEAMKEIIREEQEEEEAKRKKNEKKKPGDDGQVACPICNRRMPQGKINLHLDKCLNNIPDDPTVSPAKPSFLSSRPLQKPHPVPRPAFASPSKSTHATTTTPPAIPKEERLAKLNYAILKESGLRAKCKDKGIPWTGTKQQMEKRYTEWVNIFNANLDSVTPKTKNQLLRDLDRWEKQEAMGVLAESRNPFKQEGFSGERWAEMHDDSFQNLIAQAREGSKKRRKVEENDGGAGGGGGDGTTRAEPVGNGDGDDEMNLDTNLRRKSPSIANTTTTTTTTTTVVNQTVVAVEAMQPFKAPS